MTSVVNLLEDWLPTVNLAWQSGQLPYSWFLSSQAGDSGQPPVGNTGSSFFYLTLAKERQEAGAWELELGLKSQLVPECLLDYIPP